MTTLLILALLLAIFFDLAAASSPTFDPTLPATPMGTFYNDPDRLLEPFCEMCAMLGYQCQSCATFNPPQRAPTFTAEMFTQHEDWPEDILPPSPPSPETYFTEPEPVRQPLAEPYVRQLDENATTVQPVTVQAHVDSIYNPGDRLKPVKQTLPRRGSGKRQPPKAGGFACSIEGCKKRFNRQCDLNRHLKTHLDSCNRPHKCNICNEGFQYPKDLQRHRPVHTGSSSRALLRCTVEGCTNQGFSRKDNLLRHLRKQHKQHPTLVAAS